MPAAASAQARPCGARLMARRDDLVSAEAAFTTLLDIAAGFTDVQTEAAVLRHVLQDPVQGWRFSARLQCR